MTELTITLEDNKLIEDVKFICQHRPRGMWLEYEKAKAKITRWNLTNSQYELALKVITDELVV